MALQNFVDKVGPVISALWLNVVDAFKVNNLDRTAGEIAAGVTPTNYGYLPGDVRRYGAVLNGVTDDSQAFNDALAANDNILPWNGVALTASPIVFSDNEQTIQGNGNISYIHYTGIGKAIDFNGKDHCKVLNIKLWAPTSSDAVYIGSIAHWSTVVGCDIRGSSTGSDLSGTHSSGNGITIERSFYCDITNNDVSAFARGLYGLYECNGNFIHANSFRRNNRGIHITDTTGNSDGNCIFGNEIEGGEVGDLYAIDIQGCSNMMIFGNRLEYSPNGTAHIYIHQGVGTAYRHSLYDNRCVGTIQAIKAGDNSGVNKVDTLRINGGYYTATSNTIVIGVDCNYTAIDIDSRYMAGGASGLLVNNSTTSILSFNDDQSFTIGITGLTTSPTASAVYSVAKNIVTIVLPTLNGTSNTTACTITGLPSLIRPTSNQTVKLIVQNNSVVGLGKAVIDSSGVMTLSADVAGTVFTAANSKGIINDTITYRLGN